MTRVIDFDTIVTEPRTDDYLGVDSETGGTAAITFEDAATAIRAVSSGTAAPSANADFVGQLHVKTNSTIGAWIATQVGAGASDWLELWTSAANISSINGSIIVDASIDASDKITLGTITDGLLATGIDGAKLTAASVPTSALEDTFIANPLTANLDANSKEIQTAKLIRNTVTAGTVTISAGAVTIPFDGVQRITLNANITSISFSNLPPSGECRFVIVELVQDGTGGRTVSGWPSAVKWANNDTAPTITSTANKIDRLQFYTTDNGNKIPGFIIGQNGTP